MFMQDSIHTKWIVYTWFLLAYHVTSLIHCTLRWKDKDTYQWIWVPRVLFMITYCTCTSNNHIFGVISILCSMLVGILYWREQQELLIDVIVTIMCIEFLLTHPWVAFPWCISTLLTFGAFVKNTHNKLDVFQYASKLILFFVFILHAV